MIYNDNNDRFQHWLRKKGLSPSSVSKYASQSHNRILKDLGVSFYELNSIEQLNQLLLDVRKLEKLMEKDPRRMYSSAVSNYIKFQSETADFSNTLEDNKYEFRVEETLASLADNPEYNNSPRPRARLIEGSTTRYARDAKVGADAITLSNYECQIDSFHKFFISRRTRKNYVEAHHLIPIAYQGIFEYGIDEVENIACLCPVCHSCIHYGVNNDRVYLIDQLYNKFQTKLYTIGIEIKQKELLELYQAK